MLQPETAEQIEDIVRRTFREEMFSLEAQPISRVPRLALTIPEAARSVGYSVEGLRQQIRDHYLVPSYANSKPVIMVEELERWLRSLPPEPH